MIVTFPAWTNAVVLILVIAVLGMVMWAAVHEQIEIRRAERRRASWRSRHTPESMTWQDLFEDDDAA